ncbi:MAG: hypothetical protein HY579_05090 [Nitrospinae bacterium]|nr:hypothetical protein [Nitrospinota bacterium]
MDSALQESRIVIIADQEPKPRSYTRNWENELREENIRVMQEFYGYGFMERFKSPGLKLPAQPRRSS